MYLTILKKRRVFLSKGNKFDKLKSTLLLLDTLNNRILPVYSNSVVILLPNQHQKVSAYIDLKNLKPDLNLKDDFFNRNDFNNERKLFTKTLNNIFKNSLFIYKPYTNEAENQKTLDSIVEPIEQDIINIKIPNSLDIQ